MKYKEFDVIHAIYSLVASSDNPYPLFIINLMENLLNGYWKADVDYNGYSSQDRLSELKAIEGYWHE